MRLAIILKNVFLMCLILDIILLINEQNAALKIHAMFSAIVYIIFLSYIEIKQRYY